MSDKCCKVGDTTTPGDQCYSNSNYTQYPKLSDYCKPAPAPASGPASDSKSSKSSPNDDKNKDKNSGKSK